MLLSWVRLKTPQSSRKDAHIPIPYWPRRPPQPLSRSDLVHWHETDMAAASSHVRFQGQTGKYLLAVSISPFDLGCVKTRASRECAELFSPFSSFDGYSQRCSFPNQPNRDKISTRKFDVEVFT